jgi:uncharacterized membrane protein
MAKKRKTTQKSSDNRTAKKAEVLGNQENKKKGVVPIILVMVALVAVAGFFGWRMLGQKTTADTSASIKGVEIRGDEVFHDVSGYGDGKARYFSIQTRSGVEVRYFLLKSSDGVIRAAFDACDVCWRAGLGYAQEGDEMVCRNCGLRFPSVRINEVKGGCNPAPLQRREVDGRLVINIHDIEAGAGYFNLPM